MQLAMVQERIVPFDGLDPAYLDRGIYFGDGVYEVVRSYNGRIFALEEHLERFANSLAGIGMRGVDIEHIRSRVRRAFDAAEILDAKIYFHITRGSELRNHVADDNLEPNFFMTVTEASDSTEEKTKGISVSTHPDWRWKRCDIKSLNLLPNVLARLDAARKGCAEAILVDDVGLITEGASSSFMAIIGQTLQTAPLTANILPSITRNFIVKAAPDITLRVVEESLTPDRAREADELLIAATTEDIVPVVQFDNETIGGGKPGKYTRLLMQRFREFV
ncbi:MAG: aminotransferase class IV [Phycisphaerales bacterium]|nr:MAG: aminotransferase class IV [Phycisphaerales bacterium]